MLSAEESQTLEFKASLLTPKDTVEETMKEHNMTLENAEKKLQSDRRRIIYSSMKTIGGFVNADGGNLFIGVADRTGEILGLQRDFQKVKGRDGDGFLIELKNQIRSHYGGPGIFSCISKIEILKIEGKSTAHIKILPSAVSPYPILAEAVLNGQSIIHEKYYVRVGNSTEEFSPREFFEKHWNKHLAQHGEIHSLHNLGTNETPGHFDKAVKIDPRNARVYKDNALRAPGRTAEAKSLAPTAFDKLKNFCVDASERWRELISSQPENSPARFPHGYFEMGFSLIDAMPASNLGELQKRLHVAMRTIYTNCPPFFEPSADASYPYESFVETQIKNSKIGVLEMQGSSYYDFWRASLDGKLYTVRGYVEDDQQNYLGKVVAVSIPIWRVGKGLLFTNRLAETFEKVEQIAIQCRFTGLSGRRLAIRQGQHMYNSYISNTDEVILSKQVTLQQMQGNLAEILHQLLSPLYKKFNFFELPLDLVQSELQQMRGIG